MRRTAVETMRRKRKVLVHALRQTGLSNALSVS